MLPRKALVDFNANDGELNRFMHVVQEAVNPVLQTEVLDSNLIQSLVIPSTLKLTVPHGLGRRPLGFILAGTNANCGQPYALPADQTNAKGALVLTFPQGAGATVSVLVF